MTQEDAKTDVLEMIERASPERLASIKALLSLNDEKASFYGEALSVLEQSGYNPGIIRVAVAQIKEKEGPVLVRTRTKTHIFNFLENEDNPDGPVYKRAFYVKMITTVQKLELDKYAQEKAQLFASQAIDFKKLQSDPDEISKFVQSEVFKQLMSEPNTKFRDIVVANTVEVFPPLEENLDNKDREIPEFIYQQLEVDLSDLVEMQRVMVKNSLVADTLGY